MSLARTFAPHFGLFAGLLLVGAILGGGILGGCVIHDHGPGYADSYSAPDGGYQGYRAVPPFNPFYRAPYRSNKFEPEKHVVCNARREVCYETKDGVAQPSVRETKQYFGKDAAKDLKKDLRRRDDD